jgi:hypothetical protein
MTDRAAALRKRHRKGHLSAADEVYDQNAVCLADGHAWPCDTAEALALIVDPTADLTKARDALTRLLAELPSEFANPRNGAHRSRERFEVIKERNVGTVHDALWDLQEAVGLTRPPRA